MKSTNGCAKNRIVKPWKTSEIQYLKDNYTKKTWTEIAYHLNRSVTSVAAYARGILKLKRVVSLRKNTWSSQEDEYLLANYLKINTWDISDKLCRSYDAVKARVTYLRNKQAINKPLN